VAVAPAMLPTLDRMHAREQRVRRERRGDERHGVHVVRLRGAADRCGLVERRNTEHAHTIECIEPRERLPELPARMFEIAAEPDIGQHLAALFVAGGGWGRAFAGCRSFRTPLAAAT